MTKDDYLKLAPVGAAFAAGQVCEHAMSEKTGRKGGSNLIQ